MIEEYFGIPIDLFIIYIMTIYGLLWGLITLWITRNDKGREQ